MSDLAIRLVDVKFSYSPLFSRAAGLDVLGGVSFELFKGETLGVIGRNGAGKSTLMQLLAGIVRPDSGQVDTFVDKIQLLSLQVGFVQELTGRDNIMISAMLLGMKRREVCNKMENIVEFSGLGDFIDKPLKTYSTGMKARLGFAVSSQADPDVLLIDEAFGVGDIEFRKRSKAVIESRMKSSRAFVLVSHSEAMLKDYCERTVWLENGRVKMIDKTPDVVAAYSQYK